MRVLVFVCLLSACQAGPDVSMVGEWCADEQDAFRLAAQSWCVDAGADYCPEVHAGGRYTPVYVRREPIVCPSDKSWCTGDLDGMWSYDNLLGRYEMQLRDKSAILRERDGAPVTRGRYLDFFRCVAMHEFGHMFGLEDAWDPEQSARLMYSGRCFVPESWDDPVVTAVDRAELQ